MVAAVAADEPDTAAKMPQPRMLTCRSRPGTRPSHGARPENISSDTFERNRISPIQMNSGSEASAHELLLPQTVVAKTRPVGALVNSSMPMKPTPSRASATHTPPPSNRSSRVRLRS